MDTFWLGIAGLVVFFTACDGGSSTDPCLGETCSGHGQCAKTGDQAGCQCDQGYTPATEGLACLAEGWPPWQLATACAQPTITAGATIANLGQNMVYGMDLAWGGSEGAVIVSEPTDAGVCEVWLQRLDGQGQTVGERVSLGTTAFEAAGGWRVSLATDGQGHLACWETSTTELACAAIPLANGDPQNGLTVAGTKPALAVGPGGFVLFYTSVGGLVAQRLHVDAQADGQALSMDGEAGDFLAAVGHGSGFAVATGREGGNGFLEMHRLGIDLSVLGAPVSLATSPGARSVSLAVSGGRVAAAYSEGHAWLRVVDDTGIASAAVQVDSPTGELGYGRLDAAGGLDSFALTWSDFMGFIGYRAAGEDGALPGAIVEAADSGWDDNSNAVVGIGDGFLVAVGLGAMVTSEVKIFHLGCP